MRVHQLNIEGIGPYAGRQELDFDRLTEQGLFLLTGPTGAGKTTILDAIVFALYGTVPGARGSDGKRGHRARERIVSDLRDLDTHPQVELEFSASGRRFRVTRSPDHERRKSRGEGTTLQKAAATLQEWVDDAWAPRSTDFHEISSDLQTVLGMNAEQFAQVVLLPQGEFAGFLRATENDRRIVLERLFRVDRYRGAEAWFEAHARQAKADLAEAQGALVRVVDTLAGALGDSVTGAAPDADGGPDAIAAWIGVNAVATEERVRVARARAQEAETAVLAAEQAHTRILAIAERERVVSERSVAAASHAERLPNARGWVIEHVDPATGADDSCWDQAARSARERATTLGVAAEQERQLEALQQAQVAATQAAEAAETEAGVADAAIAAAQARLQPAQEAVQQSAGAEGLERAKRSERDGLAGQLTAARERDRLAGQVDRLQAAADAALAEHSGAASARALLPADADLDRERDGLQARRDALRARAAGLQAELAGLQDTLGRARAGLTEHERLTHEVEQLMGIVTVARDAHQAAREHALDAREQRLSAMAAELANGLDDGAPCPVCGALEHPSLAASGATHDLRAAEAQAEAQMHSALAALRAAESQHAGARAQLDALDHPALEAAVQATTVGLEAGAAERAQLDADEAVVQSELTALTDTLARTRSAVAHGEATRAAAEEAGHALARAREGFAAADAAANSASVTELSAALEQAEAQLTALTALTASAASARELVLTLERELEAQRFAGGERRTTAAKQRQRAHDLEQQRAALQARLDALRGTHPTVQAAAEAADLLAERLEAAAKLVVEHRAAEGELAAAREQLATARATDTMQPGEPESTPARVALRARAREQARSHANDARDLAAEADRCGRAVTQADAALTTALAALGPAAETADRMIRLDATVRGTGPDNTRKISLATYVLAARLEEVAAAASSHLLRMSSGRFELLHHDERYGGGQAGLGLRVRDGWTGDERDTATLSGGESFYASLALALGLAEVVTNEAGGRPLETLLVDEGFGSLDPDTLEEVLGELDQLRAQGRTIGLVSHVQTLAERIPSQLRVTPGRGGSTAEVVTA